MVERYPPFPVVLLVELVKDGFNRLLPGPLLVVGSALIQVSVVAYELGHNWEEPVEVSLLPLQGMQVEGEEEVIANLFAEAPMIGCYHSC